MPFSLKLTPVPIDKLPSFDQVLAAGREVMGDTVNWNVGKTFHGGSVKTFSKKSTARTGTNWHMRVSEHGPEDGSFTEFWNALGTNHSEHELEYIPNLSKAILLKPIEQGVSSLWSLHYTFAPPISPRTFTSYITCHLEAVAPRQGWIITIPVDLKKDEPLKSLEERGVRGRYVAVEKIKELEDGRVEWKMACCSDPRGSIPSFVTELSLAKTVANDVPRFLKWLQKKREEKGGSIISRSMPASTAQPA